MPTRHQTNITDKTNAWAHESSRGLRTAIICLVGLVIGGTLGYELVEGWSLADSFYMTILTLSTVGYGEVHALSYWGRLYSSGLIIVGMCVVAYSLNVIARSMLEGELNRLRGMKKMFSQIKSFDNHYIICGYGRLARYVIPDLLEQGKKVVVIEADPLRTIDLEALQIPYIEGSAYDDDILKAAGIDRANALLALLPDDADNVYVVLSARHLKGKLHIIARTESLAGEDKLRLAGANQIIAPYRVGGSRVVQQLINPNVNDFLEIATDASGDVLVLEHITISPDSALHGLSLQESEIRDKTGALIAALIEPDGNMILNPNRDSVLHSGATVIAIGTQKNLTQLSELI